jgi:hypothetical protein
MLLFAYQDQISLRSVTQFFRSNNVQEWLYLGDDSTWRVLAESAIADAVPRISIADRLDSKAQDLRSAYIDGIGALSQDNASLEWWSSELAAKNPYYKLYVRICLLAVARDLLSEGRLNNTLVICTTRALLDEVSYYAIELDIPFRTAQIKKNLPIWEELKSEAAGTAEPFLRYFPQLPTLGRCIPLYQKFLEKDIRYRRSIIEKNIPQPPSEFSGDDTICFFTWVDKRNFNLDSSYTDPYFGPLPRLLKEKGYRVAFVPRVLFTIPFDEAVHRLLQTGEIIFFPEQFLTNQDISISRQKGELYFPDIGALSSIGSIPVSRLISEHFAQTRSLLADNLLYENLVAAMKKERIHPSRIIHTCEGHSWEQALSWSVHRHMPKTKVIGYDNVTFSRLVLSMYPAVNEYGKRPLPDRIVTNGPLYRDVLLVEGMPEHLVSIGCALRHTYLWKGTNQEKQSQSVIEPGRPCRILVATAIGLGDSVELVSKACDAFGGDENYEIIIKCHPLVDPDEVGRYLSSKIKKQNVTFDTRPVSQLLQTSNILLYTYTSVCFESMIHGVVPVCVRSENFLNLDKLDAVPNIRWCATTPDDLRDIAGKITMMNDEARAAWQNEATRIVKQALAPPSDGCVDAFLG